jgi:catechol 2,3-dioxygenase-like lactoylglutathione lyase family enzyme
MKLAHLLLFTRNISKSIGFYSEALALKTVFMSEELAELKDSNNFRVLLKRVEGEAYCSTGFSPVCVFEVEDFEERLERVKRHGAVFDGAPIGKLVCFRAPDGHMFALKEKEEGVLGEGEEQADSATTEELKKLFQKLKI